MPWHCHVHPFVCIEATQDVGQCFSDLFSGVLQTTRNLNAGEPDGKIESGGKDLQSGFNC